MAARRQECSICMDIFKNPKLIPCHHSFCYKCLEDYVKVNLSNGRFNCPMCRKSVELPLRGVSAFQENFYIDSYSSEKYSCDICGPKSVACSRCLDCEENLCQACCYVHEKSKATRHHKISDLGTLEPEMKGRIRQRIFCDQHPEDEIRLVCKDCKALICVLCKAIKHEIRATETVSDAAAEVKKNIQIKMNQCSDKARRITDFEREADALDKKINDAEKKEIKALEDQRLQLIKIIDQEVAKMKDKIQNVYKDLRQQNAALKREMKKELKKCSTANDNARQVIDQGADIDVIKKGSDLEQLLSTAIAETVKKPMTRMDKDLFSPVEIKVRELIPFIGMMRDSTEMSLQERREQEVQRKDFENEREELIHKFNMEKEEIQNNFEHEKEELQLEIGNLQRERDSSLLMAENDKQQERIGKLKQNESRHEEDKKALKNQLDDAENRCTKIELSRRSIEGDLQRLKLAMNDKETENQVLSDHVEGLTKQMQDLEGKAQSLQLTIDRLGNALTKAEEEEHAQKDKVQSLNNSLSDSSATISQLEERVTQLQRALTSSEHDRRILQERHDSTRQAVNEAKKQNHNLMERVQQMQNELAENEVRRSELEGQVRQSHNVIVQRQEAEQEHNQQIQKLQVERQNLQERVQALQRALANIETEKREIERSTVRLEKDKNASKKTLDKVERGKIRTEEIASKSVMEKSSIDRSMQRTEEKNTDMARTIQNLQQQLTEAEQQHAQRLIDLTTRHRAETEMETERLRSAQVQAEKLLEARERANRQKIKGLEETIATLKDQLGAEMRRRQNYISHSAHTGDEIRDIRNVLDSSLISVRDSSLDPLLLETETRKLDDSLDFASSTFPMRTSHRSPYRSTPLRPGSSMRRSISPVASRRKLKK